MKGWIALILLVLVGVTSISVVSAFAQAQNTGAAEIVWNGGTSGNVHFPHQRHQVTLVDCAICHSAYSELTRRLCSSTESKLSALMIDFDVGVSVSASYIVKRVDSDYFEES